MTRITRLTILALCAALALAGCSKKQEQPVASSAPGASAGGDARGMIAPGGDASGQMPPGQMPSGEMPPGHESMMGGATIDTPPSSGSPNSAAGLTWSVPRSWSLAPERPMRVATYLVKPAGGDAEGGECGVFYFGSGQGGDVESNIQRWVAQFQNPSTPERSTRKVNGLEVAIVKVHGEFTAPSGPMMQSTGTRPDYALLGAIVGGPQGSVFFKLTGPRKTIESARGDFEGLVGSMKKE
jgi:hypothetical protein